MEEIMTKRGILFALIMVLFVPALVFCQQSGGGQSNDQLGAAPSGAVTVTLEEVASGFTSPVTMVPEPGTGRIFIIDQIGVVKILDKSGNLLDQPFMDLSGRMVKLNSSYDERGLLGFAFHPNYSRNGKFYVYYSAPMEDWAPDNFNNISTLSEFQVSDTGDQAVMDSEKVLMQIPEPYMNHEGGTLVFGPDGYLYLSLGDGGNANDVGRGHVSDWYDKNEGGNAQNITANLLGKIIRLDVDNRSDQKFGVYGIPQDNPFVGKEGLDEIYAYGFRNPYRMSFDMGGNKRLFAGDAGQELWEEIDLVEKGGNYGWNVKEGAHFFSTANPKDPNAITDGPTEDPRGNKLIDPIIEIPNAKNNDGVGLVVVGGYVYRGSQVPELDGNYIFGMWSTSESDSSGKAFTATEGSDGKWSYRPLNVSGTKDGSLGAYLLAFGQDEQGEVYALTTQTRGPTGDTGKVYKISRQAR